MASGPFDLSSLGVDTSVVPQRKFPQSKELFGQDDRINYDQTGERYILVDHDGTRWEFNENVHRWTSSVDEEDIARFQAGYVWKDDPDAAYNKKRKNSEDLGAQPKRTRNGRAESEDPTNNAIYLKNLPPDTDERELAQFAAAAGLIEDDLSTGEPRVKLYRDKNGELKGDGIVYYHRPESVYLAIDVLDGRAYRAIMPFDNVVDVTQADFETYKAKKERKKAKKDKTEKQDTSRQTNATDWKKALRTSKTKLNDLLTDWGDEELSAIIDPDARDFKFVLWINAFSVKDMQAHPRLVEITEKQIYKRSSKYGEVQRVVIFDREPDGVARVRFSTPEEARACIAGLSGKIKRELAGGQIIVDLRLSDGKEVFRKTRIPQKPGKRAEMSADDQRAEADDISGEEEAAAVASELTPVELDPENEDAEVKSIEAIRDVKADGEEVDDQSAEVEDADDANGKGTDEEDTRR